MTGAHLPAFVLSGRSAYGVAVLLVLAGCTGGGVNPDGELTVTPVPVPTDRTPTPAYRLAPGLSEAGVIGPLSLASAHAESLRASVYHVRIEERVRHPDGRVHWRVLEGTFANQTSYSMRISRGVDNRTDLAGWFYADGETLYERLVTADDVRYYVPREVLAAGSSYPQDPLDHPSQRNVLYVALSGARPTYVGSETIDGETYYRIAESSRVNDDFLAAWAYVEAISDYEVEALVSDDGFVRSYRIEYVATVRGERRRVVRMARWTRLGNATVPVPEWYETAKERTGD